MEDKSSFYPDSESHIMDLFSNDLALPNPPSDWASEEVSDGVSDGVWDGVSHVNPESLKGKYLIYFIHSVSSQRFYRCH